MITDTHAGIRNDSMVFHDYMKKNYDWFFSIIDDQDIRTIVHLGDLFDRRKYVNYLTSKRIREDFLLQVENRNLDCHIIAGNHDVFYKNTNDINALSEMVTGRYKGINTYINATEINVNGTDILLLPWISDDNHEHSYKLIENSKCDVVMGHLELNGFEMFKGTVSNHGVDRKVYDKFDLVFSGHYHHKSSAKNIHYIGAFAEFIWSDYNDPRGFTIFDTNTRKFEFYQSPYNIFQMIVYDDVKTKDILNEINKTDYSKYSNVYVKVICINRTNPYAFDTLIDKIHTVSPIDISIVEDVSFLDESEDIVEGIQDTRSIIDAYINNLTLPVDNDKMKKFMRDIYTEAVSLKHIE